MSLQVIGSFVPNYQQEINSANYRRFTPYENFASFPFQILPGYGSTTSGESFRGDTFVWNGVRYGIQDTTGGFQTAEALRELMNAPASTLSTSSPLAQQPIQLPSANNAQSANNAKPMLFVVAAVAALLLRRK